MIKASFFSYLLEFKKPSGTSRGILTHKKIWIVKLWHENNPNVYGCGECNPLVDLSIDDRPDFEEKLTHFCTNINEYINPTLNIEHSELLIFPSIRFAIETAHKDLLNGGKRILFNNDFSQGNQGIEINGLVWMGSKKEMHEQVQEKINKGFTCIKLKIGAIDFESELSLIQSIREKYSSKEIEIRVDANGSFTANDVMHKLQKLSIYNIHSIEQPIKQGQGVLLAELCTKSPIAIALDEELITHQKTIEKKELIKKIKPQYLVLKPSLLGGWRACEEWISIAEENKIKWWITSALESNIGLNAIAQWTYNFNLKTAQGLGTGELYKNNFQSPLSIQQNKLYFTPHKKWASF